MNGSSAGLERFCDPAAGQPWRLLLLAGTPDEAEVLLAPLRAERPDLAARVAGSRETFARALEADGYDVIVAEYALPGFQGPDALALARRSAPLTPFIFVSGTPGEEIVIESLRQGATDYVLRHRLGRLSAVVARAVAEARERLERRQAEERLRLLVAELSHRVKNTLASVLSIARQSMRGAASLEEFDELFLGRLMALSDAHGLLSQSDWTGATLADVAARTLAPFRPSAEGQIDAAGPALTVSPKMALSLSMMFHELAANAVKHGALGVAAGRVAIDWRCVSGAADADDREAGHGGDHVELRWTERGGPPVAPPSRHGFGTKLIERGVPYELDGTVRLDFAPEGFSCRIDFPLPEQWPAPVAGV